MNGPSPEPRATQPARISVSKSKGVEIDWMDGHHSSYPLQYLREHCPCATCAHGRHAAQAAPASPFPMYRPALRIEAVEPAGAYAISIKWNDGHATGIYSFEYLRKISPEQ